MRRIFFVLVILGCAALLAGLVAGQQQPAKQMTMEVSIVATANNAPVEDLKVGDVSVKDNNKKQEIVSFEKVVGGTAATPGKPGLYNIVMLDCLNTTYRDLPENRLELLKVVSELSKAGPLTLLMLRQGLKVVDDPGMQPPTLLRRFAAQGGQGLEGAKPALDPYDWVFSEQLGLYQLFTPAGVFDRRRIEDSMGAMKTIAINYQPRSGRKNLIWISQGFPITVGENPTGYDATALGATTPTASRADDLSVYAKDMIYTSQMLMNANVSVYPVDGRYLSVNDTSMSDQGNMTALAKETGGVAYLSRRDVANAVRDALNDTRITYVLKYNMSNLKFDGSSHAIKVDTTRKDVKLRYRGEFFAPKQAPK